MFILNTRMRITHSDARQELTRNRRVRWLIEIRKASSRRFSLWHPAELWNTSKRMI
jgi:hypothetical protein